jgi:hypothetical protein
MGTLQGPHPLPKDEHEHPQPPAPQEKAQPPEQELTPSERLALAVALLQA